MIIHKKDGRWQSQLFKRLKWELHYPFTSRHVFNNGRPCPMWFVPLDGWITDPNEIIEAIANDPDLSIRYSKSVPKRESRQ